MKPFICLISGTSGSGKTTLLERLIPALRVRGYEVATAKHHRGAIEVDRPGKDSWRHRQAGAKATFLVAGDGITAFFDRPEEVRPEDLIRLVPPGVSLFLVEGFKGRTELPRIQLVLGGGEGEEEGPCRHVVRSAVVDLDPLQDSPPVLAADDIDGIADLLAQRLSSTPT